MGDDITIGVTEIVNNIEVTAQPNDQIIDINVVDNTDEVTLNITPTVIEINVNKGSSYAKWGGIVGTLSDQTDLQNALDLKANLVDGKVPASELPSYVDDIIEVANYAALPTTGETGKIYVTLDNNKIYRWSGSIYIEIAANSAVWGAITGTLSSQTDLQSALNLRVPYTGATSNVNLGEYGLTGGFLALDTTPTSTPTGIGTIYWDSANRTAALIDGDGDTTLQIGQEQRILVHNNTGSTLTDGQVVYVTGSTGNLPSVSLANASSETTSAATLGVVTESIVNGADGFITTSGIVNGLNTLAFNEGDLLWLGTTAGTFTATKPISPNHLVLIGYVIKKAGGNGSILVKIQNTQELEESSDVLFTSLTNNDILTYESSTDLWKNKSISTILGYTPANDSNVVHKTGNETIDGFKQFIGSVSFSGTSTFIDSTTGLKLKQSGLSNYNQIQAIDGGFQFFENVGTSFYFNIQQSSIAFGLNTKKVTFNNSNLTSDRIYDLPNAGGTIALTYQLHDAVTIGTANGLSLSGQALSLALASTSTTGALSSTDWNTFNGKQNALTNPITGTGTTNYLPKFTGSTALGNSLIYDNGTNVGIGTTSPSAKLHVIGASESLRLGTTTSDNYFTFFNSTGTQLGDIGYDGRDTNILSIWNNSNGGVLFGANGAERMRITSGGNVGIGTTSPTEKLDVNGIFRSIVTSISSTGEIAAKILGYPTSPFGLIFRSYSSGATSIQSQREASNSELFPLLLQPLGGNVGIGTTSPNSYGAGYAGLTLDGSTTSFITARANGVNKITLSANGGGGTPVIQANDATTDLGFQVGGSERMRITSGGNVGIGTTSPDNGKLTILKNTSNATESSYGIAIQSNASNAYTELLLGADDTVDCGVIQTAGKNTSFTSKKLALQPNGGNVGIGTTSPSYTLHVNGSVAGTSAYVNLSDKRHKKDILPIQNALDKILALNGVTFNWDKESTDINLDDYNHIGLLAQDVEEIIPQVVVTAADDNKTKSVAYTDLVPVLIEAIKELEERIKILKK